AERTLHAGESWSGSTRAVDIIRNSGSDEARVLKVELIDAVATTSDPMPNVNGLVSDPMRATYEIPIEAATSLPGGPGRVTLEQLTVAPGEALPAYSQIGLNWIGIGAGRLGVKLEGEHLPFRWKSGQERTFSVAEMLPVIPVGTKVTLRNAGDAP